MKKGLFIALFCGLLLSLSSCEKDSEIVSTATAYDLEGTSWGGKYSIRADNDVYTNYWTFSFISKNAGNLLFGDNSYGFTYHMDGNYGYLSHTDYDGMGQLVPNDAEIHIIDKNHLSIGGWVHTRK